MPQQSQPSVSDLADAPPWSDERLLALPGRCRGAAIGDWAAACSRRWGPDAVRGLREAIDADAQTLADEPNKTDWLPIHVWLRLTDAIVARHLDGDLRRLEPMVVEDARKAAGLTAKLVARQLGPARILGASARIHGWLYDVGEVQAETGDNAATLRWSGAAVFGQPTWRALQVFALRGAIETAGGAGAAVELLPSEEDGFTLMARWR